MIYAGVGSRQTPRDVYNRFMVIGSLLAATGNLLRSGRAPGSDTAFEVGSKRARGSMELFDASQADAHPHWMDHAARFHPKWNSLEPYEQKLHARNSAIMLGADLSRPVACVVCWTGDGLVKGGTGQPLRIAADAGIPVFNFGTPGAEQRMWQFINELSR